MRISVKEQWLEYLKGGVGSGIRGHVTNREKKEALDVLDSLTRSGGSVMKRLSKEQENFLQQTVDNKEYIVYRGLSLIRQRLSKEQIEQLQTLKPGMTAPSFLNLRPKRRFKPTDKEELVPSIYSSSSKKESVAVSYSREGKYSVVLKANVQKPNILCDGENIGKIAKVDKGRINYYKKYKEVFLIEPVSYTIHSVKINKSLGITALIKI